MCVSVPLMLTSLQLATAPRNSLLLYFVSARGLFRKELQTGQLWFPQGSLSFEGF